MKKLLFALILIISISGESQALNSKVLNKIYYFKRKHQTRIRQLHQQGHESTYWMNQALAPRGQKLF